MASLVIFSGCGGGASDASLPRCTLQDYNKTDLPITPASHSFSANPLYYQQWGIHYDPTFYESNRIDPDASIHMDGEHRWTGRGVKVAIIDDALDTTHEDLQGAIVATYDVATGTTDVTPPDDNATHGTEVTGLIGARNNDLGIVGVAPEAKIYFIKLPFEGYVTTDDIVEAFQKAMEWGVDVVNCSWGSGNVDDAVRQAIETLARQGRGGKGTVIVFAAGNGNAPIGNDESSIPEVIAVGATNKFDLRSSYSAYGPELDVMAPGGEYLGLTTLDQMGHAGESVNDYVLYDDPHAFGGTSAAAPLVTGVVAQLLEANPHLTRANVYNALACSADKIGNRPYGTDGFNDYYGYGKVNANRALSLVR